MAGITYKDRLVNYFGEEDSVVPTRLGTGKAAEKTYQVDVNGFLVNPTEWDEEYAVRKADELGIPGGLARKHWQIIRFLRDRYEKNGIVPMIFECCEANDLELDDLEKLFTTGYHRGAVKIAGLRVK